MTAPKIKETAGGPQFCGRCAKPIRVGQAYTEFTIEGATGAGDTVFWHAHGCRRAAFQTSPAGLGR